MNDGADRPEAVVVEPDAEGRAYNNPDGTKLVIPTIKSEISQAKTFVYGPEVENTLQQNTPHKNNASATRKTDRNPWPRCILQCLRPEADRIGSSSKLRPKGGLSAASASGQHTQCLTSK